MIRIILIDDHQLFREGLKAMFQPEPDITVVAEAATALEGVEAAERCPCDLFVADFSLPDYEAPWLLEQLRKRRAEVRVLMISQYTDFDKVRQILALGANGYLVKTAKREELMQAVSIVAAGGIYIHPAVARALTVQPDPAAGQSLVTPRERAILQLLVEGLSNPAIARRLHVSLGTIKGDMQQLFSKLAVTDRTRLAATALAKGLVEHPEHR